MSNAVPKQGSPTTLTGRFYDPAESVGTAHPSHRKENPAMTATNATPKKAKPKRHDWKPAFLKALAACPDVTKAASHADVDRATAYRARQSDEAFAIAWHDAINSALDDVEAALIERAKDKDTTAAIFLLKSHRRELYGERQEITHKGGVQLSEKSDAELRELAAALTGRRDACTS